MKKLLFLCKHKKFDFKYFLNRSVNNPAALVTQSHTLLFLLYKNRVHGNASAAHRGLHTLRIVLHSKTCARVITVTCVQEGFLFIYFIHFFSSNSLNKQTTTTKSHGLRNRKKKNTPTNFRWRVNVWENVVVVVIKRGKDSEIIITKQTIKNTEFFFYIYAIIICCQTPTYINICFFIHVKDIFLSVIFYFLFYILHTLKSKIYYLNLNIILYSFKNNH